jgi:glycolate oxidase
LGLRIRLRRGADDPVCPRTQMQFTNSAAMPNLTADLTALLEPARVLHSREDMLAYGYDGTAALSGVPAVVVMVKTVEEVAAIVKYAAANRTPIVGRGSGTGLSGGSVPSMGCIVLCTAQMDKVIELDEKNLTVLVESGCITQKVS